MTMQQVAMRVPSERDVDQLLRSLARPALPEQLQLGLRASGRMSFQPEAIPGRRLAGWRIVRKEELSVLQVEARMLRNDLVAVRRSVADRDQGMRRLQGSLRLARARAVELERENRELRDSLRRAREQAAKGA